MLLHEFTAVILFLFMTTTNAQNQANGTIARGCRLVPSAGVCREDQKRTYWSYSSKTSSCTQLFGCYSIRDRNVFMTKQSCESNCFVTNTGGDRPVPLPGTGMRIADQCRLNPSPGRCEPNRARTFWSYSAKTGTCVQVTGCYTTSDRNIFVSRDNCRKGCFVGGSGGNGGGLIPPPVLPGTPTTLPAAVDVNISPECRLNPSPGACAPGQQKTWYTFSAKTGGCVRIYGCYNVRDRNVFMSDTGCRQRCLVADPTPGQEWKRDPQCYLNPTPGRCPASDRRSFWTYSSNIKSCTQIYGCYGLRDRNVFQTQDSCNRMCVGNQMLPEVAEKITNLQGMKIATECRINPSPGRCANGDKRTFYSYSSKTGDCAQIFGCYEGRDRNVFLTRDGCRRGCFINENDTAAGSMELQCYVNPSVGRCPDNRKTRYWSYSSKTGGCQQIYGCYSVRDRNVFMTKQACQTSCTSAAVLPVRPEGRVNMECRVTPSPGVCRDGDKRQFYSYSSKTESCMPIYGCYGVRDRNVFLSQDGCNKNCFITDGTTNPSGGRDNQCYLVPSPGRCQPSQRRVYYSYSPKIDQCTRLEGCYSIRDRNVFVTRKSCIDTCDVVIGNSTDLLPGENQNIALECRINPSPGVCREDQKRRYYSYSGKTRRCTQIYGCYSIRDRNVFLTESGCRQNCFLGDTPTQPGGVDQQCYVIPAQGRCPESEKTNYWSYSPKISACAQIYGCYSFRDRNVFLTRPVCDQTCGVDGSSSLLTMPNNTRVSIECRVNPSPGRCRPGESRRYYSYSSKTGSCVMIDGCYSVRDRNVFITRQNCRQSCFVNDNKPPSGRNQQCYINPAAGVCAESQKRSYWTYSSKIDACVQLYGCYSARDRNIFLTRDQCRSTCADESSAVITPPIENATIAIECLVNPSPGNCAENQRTRYFTYSGKSGTCVQIYGCYSVRDRNVFVTESGCRQSCFMSGPRPSGRDNQCYLNPSPGRCRENQKRAYWSYSSKLDACTELYGCYTLKDRNIFPNRDSCRQTCAVDSQSAFLTDPRNVTVAVECLVNPSPGVCRENERTRYYSYSSKLGTCTQIYGCYSIRDRNVYLTRENCRQNCFTSDNNPPSDGRDGQCYINPSPSRCSNNERRRYWTFSSKLQACTQIYGCYSIRDRNVFPTRDSCRQVCAVDVAIVDPINDRTIAPECRLNPTPGNCRDNERTRYYSYSSKTGTCIQLFGCYSIRDRNMFLTRQSCQQNCFLGDGGRPQPDNQCYLNPTPGQCASNERRSYWTHSSKTRSCVRIYGCYSIRDRNVFITQSQCELVCLTNDSITIVPPISTVPPYTTMPPFTTPPVTTTPGMPGRVKIECRFNPNPGMCRESEKRSYYSFSSKTESCVPIYGCYSVRDRNVYMTENQCTRDCFIGGDNTGPPYIKDPQCFINPSPGRCDPSQRRTFFTYSAKTHSCVQLYGCYSVRDRNLFMDRKQCRRACVNADFSHNDEIQALTDITPIRLENGLRLARECMIIPTPGLCLPVQERTFWSFSTKMMGCTRLTGCYDIHDRNTWLTQDGCQRNCFKNDSEPVVPGVTPLECQMNPTPGRCLPSERRTFWSYNLKVNYCTQITGCYDFHDRNVWASRERCQTKCRVIDTPVQPLLPDGNLDSLTIARECHVNPPPGRCLESEKLTYWSFSSKTGTCIRIRGCYSIRDRNTWLTRDACNNNCILSDGGPPPSDKTPLACRLVPTPGRCHESQRKLVWTYSEKLGACIEIIGCYDFHDRNVWRTRENCNQRCHVTDVPLFPDMSEYDVDLECQLNPSPGMCHESEQRAFYAFSTKAMACVEIYGCYSINDRNAWYTRKGCLNSCLVPKSNGTSRPVAPGCRVTPSVKPCRPGQKTSWSMYDQGSEQCVDMQGCYRLGDRNVFINKNRCEFNCFRNTGPNYERRECYLNPSPGVCRDDERRVYWSYNKKTSTCMRVEGCYSIRDRNVWLTEAMCENNCLRPDTLSSSPNALPDFMSGASVSRNGESVWGRRGRTITRNMRQGELTAPNNGAMRIITANNMRNTNIVRNSNTSPVLRTQTLGTSRNTVINEGQTLGMNRNGVNGGLTLGMNRNGVNGGQTLGMNRNGVNGGLTLGMNRNGVNGGLTLGMNRNGINGGQTLGMNRNGVNGGQTLGMNRNGINGGQTLGISRNTLNGVQALGMSRNTVNEGQMQASAGLTAGRSNSVRVVQVSPRGNGNGNAQLPGSKVVASLFRT